MTVSKVFFTEERLKTVRKIAYNIYKNYGCCYELEELVQWGILGLAEAYESYEEDRDTQFMSYAGHRIKGAILDGVRKMSPIPHQAYNSEQNPDTKDEKLQSAIKLSVDDPNHFIELASPDSVNPEVICFKKELLSDIISSSCLSDFESQVLTMYFLQDVRLRDIAWCHNISEVRVSQVKNSAIKKLKDKYEREGT